MLKVTEQLILPEQDWTITATRSQGPGGQNVNKVATAVILRFDINASSLPQFLKTRLLATHDRRISNAGVLVIKAQQSRSQERNLELAKQRLVEFIRSGMLVKKKRIPTKPSKAEKQRRLMAKNRRGELKNRRAKIGAHDSSG